MIKEKNELSTHRKKCKFFKSQHPTEGWLTRNISIHLQSEGTVSMFKHYTSMPGCSKLTMPYVNKTSKFKYIMRKNTLPPKNVMSFCSAVPLLLISKNISTLHIYPSLTTLLSYRCFEQQGLAVSTYLMLLVALINLKNLILHWFKHDAFIEQIEAACKNGFKEKIQIPPITFD